MSEAPGSYFVLDPGRTAGFASCLAGGAKIRHGTWRFSQKAYGAAYVAFGQYLRRMLSSLPDPQMAMELTTIVTHGENNQVNAQQVIFSAGWPAIAFAVCHDMGLREPQMIAIQSWRSRTHRKVQAPKGYTQTQRSNWFKQQAKDYCDKQGWSYSTPDEAEALCMLEALRIEHEPGLAFDKGMSCYQQGSLL